MHKGQFGLAMTEMDRGNQINSSSRDAARSYVEFMLGEIRPMMNGIGKVLLFNYHYLTTNTN